MSKRLPRLIGRAIRVADKMATALAYLSGCALLVLSFFVTIDVLGRRFGGFYSRATDEIAGYGMVLITSWALAYALAGGRHIRIDVCLHWFPARIRRFLDCAGLFLLVIFASILAYNCWSLAFESYEMDAHSMALQVRTAYPQAIMAAGFTFLALQAAIMFLASPFRELEELHEANREPGTDIYEI